MTNNPIAQAVAFNQMIVAVFNDLLGVQLVGPGSRRGSKKWRITDDNPWGIFGRVNAACLTTETQRNDGLHGYALVFEGLVTPGKIAAVAHKEIEREKLLTRVPRISSAWMNEVTRELYHHIGRTTKMVLLFELFTHVLG